MRYPHWQFFESLDEDLHSLSRIIEFGEDNYKTHSVRLARLYLSICSEIDVVAKLLCARIAPSQRPGKIDDYRSVITAHYKNFALLKVEMPAHGLDLQPWQAWSSDENPPWWKSYNNVKHQRNKHYREANLENVLGAAAGLLVMLIYFHQPDLYELNPPLQPLFKTMRIETRFVRTGRIVTHYSLPDFGRGKSG
jgi:hypothetical protein